MSYKDLNVYQRAYKVAIDLHQYLEKVDSAKFTTDEIQQFKDISRNIIGEIAEGYSQRTNKAKRFFNFKALDHVHSIMMDLDFLHDTNRLSEEKHKQFYSEYEIVAKMLYKQNKLLLNPQKDESKIN